jgi:hypothetical protein
MILMTASDAQRLGIEGLGAKKRRKYNNHPCEVDGHKFDSQLEATYYGELLLRERAGEVESIDVHPRFVVVDADGHGPDVVYEADFGFGERGPDGWGYTVIDCKSEATITPLFRLKWRLMQQRYPMWDFRVEVR